MMRLRQLDPDFAKSRRNGWKKALKKSALLVGLMWLLWLIDTLTPLNAQYLGIYPRHLYGLTGIVTAPLAHSDLTHLMSNTLPIFLAAWALFGNYPTVARRVFVLAWLATGMLVWLLARSSWHLGASGLLYALLVFLSMSGFIRRDMQSVAISMVLLFLYGGMVFGVVPDQPQISWESHLFGLVTGGVLAWWYRKADLPVFRHYDFENDDNDDSEDMVFPTIVSEPPQDMTWSEQRYDRYLSTRTSGARDSCL